MNCNQEEFSLQTYTPLKTLYLQSNIKLRKNNEIYRSTC